MDFVKKQLGGQKTTNTSQQQGGGGLTGGVNNALGGGQSGEANEDGLDKGLDFVQKKYMGAGDQSNESAVEQAKDEKITDGIRSGYKSTTGHAFPIADK